VIELERHIEILLLSNDCVIVPGLGGFMAHYVEARYDEEDQMFLPPLRTLGFNPQLKMNDSLLVQSYVEAYDLSYPEALRRIDSEVEELRQHLYNEGSYELNDIGLLALNDDGHLVFTPCEAGILTPCLYGLSSFRIDPLTASVATRKAVPRPVAAIQEAAEPVSATYEGADIVSEGVAPPDSIDEDDEDGAIVIRMAWVRNAIAIAAAVVAFFLMTTPVGSNDQEGRNISNLQSLTLVTRMPKDTNQEKIDFHRTDMAHKEVKADSSKAVVAQQELVLSDSLSKGYSIVLASYITKKNARDFVDELHKKGFAEARVYIRNNVTRVVYGCFDSENEAYNRLRELHGEKGFEEAWILKLKKNA